MGTTQTHYAMVGIVLQGDALDVIDMNEEYDKFEKYDDNGRERKIGCGPNGMTFIYDGMNGNYAVYGKIVGKGLECEGLNIVVFDKISKKLRKKIAEGATELLGQKFSPDDVVNVTFTHWY